MNPNTESISIKSLLNDKKFCRLLLWYILIGAHAYETGIRIFFKRKKRKKYLHKELSEESLREYKTYKIDFLSENVEILVSKYPEIIEVFKNEFFIPEWSEYTFTEIISSVRKIRNILIHPKPDSDIDKKFQHLFFFFDAFLLPEKKKQLIAKIHSFAIKWVWQVGKPWELTLWQLDYILSDNEKLRKRRADYNAKKKRGNFPKYIQKQKETQLKKYQKLQDEFTPNENLNLYNFRHTYNTFGKKYFFEMKTIFEQYKIPQEIVLYKNSYFLFCDLFEIYIDSFWQIKENLIAKWFGTEKKSFRELLGNTQIEQSLKEKVRTLRNDIEHNEFHKYLKKDSFHQSMEVFSELCEQLWLKMIQNEFLQKIKSRFEQEKFIRVEGEKKKVRHWNEETRTLYQQEKKIRNPLSKYVRQLARNKLLEK